MIAQQKPIPTTLEDINDALNTLQFNMDHKYHSAMEHFDLLRHMELLKSEKAEMEAKLKIICNR